MALVTNGLIALFSFWAYKSLKHDKTKNPYWKLFYLFLGVSSALGALGHTFYGYFGIPGKMPSWAIATLGNICSALAILKYNQKIEFKNPWVIFVIAKSVLFLSLALITYKFTFIACDAIVSYLVFTGGYAGYLKQKGIPEMKFMILGVLVMLPSAFVFLFKWSPFLWLNKDDISHLLIVVGVACFYIGAKKLQSNKLSLYDYVQ